MNNQTNRICGNLLVTGAVLMVITMVLHPSGGSIQHILAIAYMAIISHAIAIASLPVLFIGYWGVTKRLSGNLVLSYTALATMALGLIAAMLAGALNGIVLPTFIQHFKDADTNTINNFVKPVAVYNGLMNHAFDYILIFGSCAAIVLWSVAILRTDALPKWLAYLGFTLCLLAVAGFALGFNMTNLHGFTVFVLGFVVWTVVAGVQLARTVEV